VTNLKGFALNRDDELSDKRNYRKESPAGTKIVEL
jgi:hypothetical protein